MYIPDVSSWFLRAHLYPSWDPCWFTALHTHHGWSATNSSKDSSKFFRNFMKLYSCLTGKGAPVMARLFSRILQWLSYPRSLRGQQLDNGSRAWPEMGETRQLIHRPVVTEIPLGDPTWPRDDQLAHRISVTSGECILNHFESATSLNVSFFSNRSPTNNLNV